MLKLSKKNILEGSIPEQLLLFFFPVLLEYIFSQLYNTIDAMIVGTFVGKEALAAVGGTTGTSISLLVNFIWGLTSGVSVITAQYYGRHDFEGVHNAVKTGMFLGLTLGLSMTIIGIIFTPSLLSLLNVPSDFYNLSVTYMQIYLSGLIPFMLYNVGASILRATGDSKRPLYFLIVSAIVNIILDYIFVRFFNWGVAGAAIATVIAQIVGLILMLILLKNTNDCYQFEIKNIGYNGSLLKKIILIGLPSGIQSVVYSISNLFIQARVNIFGTNTTAAYTAFGKIDGFYWNYDAAFGVACMTVAGQNYGAGKIDRVKMTVKIGLLLEIIGSILIGGLCYMFATPLIGLFTKDAVVITIGIEMLKLLSFTWVTFNPIQIISSVCKSCGDTIAPMIISATFICGVRLIYLLFVPYNTVLEALYCYPISWIITSITFIIYYKTDKWMKKVV